MTSWQRIQVLGGVTTALVVAGAGWWFGGLMVSPEYPERRGYAVEGVAPVELAALQRSWPGGGQPGDRDQLYGYIARIDQAVVPEPAGGIAAGPALPPPDLGTLLADADAARGEKTAAVCASCHTFDRGGANRTGPNLFAVVGRPIGAHAGFAYSDAVKSHGGAWTYEELDRYLTSPPATFPATRWRSPASATRATAPTLSPIWPPSRRRAALPRPAAAGSAGGNGAARPADRRGDGCPRSRDALANVLESVRVEQASATRDERTGLSNQRTTMWV